MKSVVVHRVIRRQIHSLAFQNQNEKWSHQPIPVRSLMKRILESFQSIQNLIFSFSNFTIFLPFYSLASPTN